MAPVLRAHTRAGMPPLPRTASGTSERPVGLALADGRRLLRECAPLLIGPSDNGCVSVVIKTTAALRPRPIDFFDAWVFAENDVTLALARWWRAVGDARSDAYAGYAAALD